MQALTSEALSEALGALLAISQAEPELLQLYQRLLSLQEQLKRGHLHVAVLGQFKRGKSTFLNALLGEAVLPVGVIPLTAVPVLLLPGTAISARIHFKHGGAPLPLKAQNGPELETQLATYVAEAQNPHNRYQVDFVEVFYPSALLQQGLVLMDTPGIGSTFLHNTETTRSWLESCDVGIWVVSGEPPITEAELVFLRELAPQVSEWWVVFNKKDQLSSLELGQNLDFLKQVLLTELGSNKAIFPLSARQGLLARQTADQQLWQDSGFAELEATLLAHLAERKQQLLLASVRQRALGLAEKIQFWLKLWLKAQAEPLAELIDKLANLEQQILVLQREQQKIEDLLHMGLKRQLRQLEDSVSALLSQADSFFSPLLQTLTEKDTQTQVKQLFETQIPPYFEAQLLAQTEQARQALHALFLPSRQRLTELCNTLLHYSGELFGLHYTPVFESGEFVLFQDPYWVSQDYLFQDSLLLRGLENFLPSALKQTRLKKRLQKELHQLLLRNTANLGWSLQVSLKENFRKFETDMQQAWKETLELSQTTLKTVLEQRQQNVIEFEQRPLLLQKTAQSEQLQGIITALNSGLE